MELKRILIEYGGKQLQNQYNLFRKLVLRILEKKANEQNKKFDFDINTINDFNDAELPQGIDDINQPTVIDIRLFPNKNIPLNYKSILLDEMKESRLNWKENGFIAVVANRVTPSQEKTIRNQIETNYKGIKFEIWDINFISELFEKYAEYLYDIIPEITNLAIKNVVNKTFNDYDWKIEREKHIKKLQKAYDNDELVLFLGAGVSASAGMPSWDSLLSQLLITLIETNLPENLKATEEQKIGIADSLKKANVSSPLLEARYIRSGLGDSFENEVSNILYNNISTKINSELINAISLLCAPPRGSLGIKAIINYNFDDLIEVSLKNRELGYKPIFRETDLPTKKELGIYHVHGFLPRKSSSYDGISDSLLVFSEENYHILMQDPYHWSNLVQLNFLKDSICLLIGLSGTDPNLRRLLEIAKRKTNRSSHYILLKRESSSIFQENLETNDSNYTELTESIHKVHHNLNERSLEELGLNIIWYKNYSEIPELILKIIK